MKNSIPETGTSSFRRGAVFLTFLLGISGCDVFGPSDFFRALDTDRSGSLDLDEWMSYYGPHEHPWERCSGHDFEPADCNGDLELSWAEYHSARFKSDFCGDPQAHLTIYQKPVLDPATGRYVLLPPACEIDLTRMSQQPEAAFAAPGSARSVCEVYGVTVAE